MTNVSDIGCGENQNTHFMLNQYLRKSYSLWDYVEKYGTARRATDGNKVRRMRFVCRLLEARMRTHTNNFQYVLPFHGNSGYPTAPQCCLIRTLPLSFILISFFSRSKHFLTRNICSVYQITNFDSQTGSVANSLPSLNFTLLPHTLHQTPSRAFWRSTSLKFSTSLSGWKRSIKYRNRSWRVINTAWRNCRSGHK
jgi:hypothetical protein